MINKEDRVLVFGGTGKVGRHFVQLLQNEGYSYASPLHCQLDMLYENSLWKYLNSYRPDFIVNLSAVSTTIETNRTNPAIIHRDTLKMNMNLLSSIIQVKDYCPKKIINIISSCAYGLPMDQSDILREEDFLRGNVHESVRPHGESKKQVYLMSQFYRQQFNLPVTCICFNSICGGESWDKPETLKVLPALVKKIVDAREANLPSVEVWGTGAARREFIFVSDCAEGIYQVLNRFDGDLINIGTGRDLPIKQIVGEIKKFAKYNGNIVYNKNYQDGQLRKLLSVEKMRNSLDWFPKLGFIGMYESLISEYEQYLKDNKCESY